jgi:hypothetical protein
MSEVLIKRVKDYLSINNIPSSISEVTTHKQFYELLCNDADISTLTRLDQKVFDKLISGANICGPLELFIHTCSHLSWCGAQLDDLMIDLVILCFLLDGHCEKKMYLEYLGLLLAEYSLQTGFNTSPHLRIVNRVIFNSQQTIDLETDFYLDFILVFDTENIKNFIAKNLPELVPISQFIII